MIASCDGLPRERIKRPSRPSLIILLAGSMLVLVGINLPWLDNHSIICGHEAPLGKLNGGCAIGMIAWTLAVLVWDIPNIVFVSVAMALEGIMIFFVAHYGYLIYVIMAQRAANPGIDIKNTHYFGIGIIMSALGLVVSGIAICLFWRGRRLR